MEPDDNLALMTWRARPDMSCEYVNRAWLDYTGYTPEEALGEGWARCVHPEDLARWLDACVRAFDERKPFEIEYRLRRRDGVFRWVSDRGTPRHAADGLFVGFGGACVDIDALKRDREGLARALERERRLRVSTEEASRARHELTLAVLQELQPPAQAIATWAAHLRGTAPAASDGAYALEAIERSARTQSRMISNLLELTQASAGESAPAARRAQDGPMLTGVRVLVVDDNRDARQEVARLLELAGADVRIAANSTEALHTLGAWRPDVVLSETNESFIRALRALPAELGGCLRAAALTGNNGGDDRAALAAGYDAQLQKPVEPVALLATVARLAA